MHYVSPSVTSSAACSAKCLALHFTTMCVESKYNLTNKLIIHQIKKVRLNYKLWGPDDRQAHREQDSFKVINIYEKLNQATPLFA